MSVEASTERSHRDTLLHEGMRQIFRNGVHGTTVDGLLAASGVPKGSFYHHFGTKERFVSAVLERYGAFHRRRLAAWQQRDGLRTPEQVAGYFRELTGIFVRSGYLYSDLSGKVVCELAVASDPLREQIAENMQEFLAAMTQVIADGQQRGDVRGDRDPRQLASAAHALIDGAFLVAQSTHDENALESIATALERLLSPDPG